MHMLVNLVLLGMLIGVWLWFRGDVYKYFMGINKKGF